MIPEGWQAPLDVDVDRMIAMIPKPFLDARLAVRPLLAEDLDLLCQVYRWEHRLDP